MLKRLASFLAIAVLPAVASIAPGATPPAGVWHTANSRNWAGYAASGASFTGVAGSWTVPQGSGSGADATWVGIGGQSTGDLIQAGTEETISRDGTVRYDAWIEMLPAVSQPVSLPVRAGDSVSVSVNQVASGQWQLIIRNNTTGQQYQSAQAYPSSLSSAEWIEEAPSSGRAVLPLDNFGTVSFTGASTLVNGGRQTIAQANAQTVTMVAHNGQALAKPSSLAPDGQSFSVSYAGSTVPVTEPVPVITEPFPAIPGVTPRPFDRLPFPFAREGRHDFRAGHHEFDR